MAGQYAFTRRPAWIAGHLIVAVLFVAMVLLGHWQLTVSERKHFNLQNFGYAFQWWIFACFGVGMWLRIIRDNARARAGTLEPAVDPERNNADGEPVEYRRYVVSDKPVVAEDATQASYNDYLQRMNDERTGQ